MVFIIDGLKYDTEKMEKIANVKRWYEERSLWVRSLYNEKVGRYYDCVLWRSKKGNWLLTHEQSYKIYGEVLCESEAKELLMRYDLSKYEEMYEEIPEA